MSYREILQIEIILKSKKKENEILGSGYYDTGKHPQSSHISSLSRTCQIVHGWACVNFLCKRNKRKNEKYCSPLLLQVEQPYHPYSRHYLFWVTPHLSSASLVSAVLWRYSRCFIYLKFCAIIARRILLQGIIITLL